MCGECPPEYRLVQSLLALEVIVHRGEIDLGARGFDQARRHGRLHPVEQAGADVVATSCPACMIRLKHGLPERVDVKHVAQMLHEAYEAAEKSVPGEA